MNAEKLRLQETKAHHIHWKRWGPYLSERQWGTVREDYSATGEAWDYFPHEQARSRAYRWGEDGIGGISDYHQHICFGLAVWNGHDPILKERLFGLTGPEGNHGEDVKELYYYLDATPTHSYLKMLYKYPQTLYNYAWLVEENRRRGKDLPEFELIDTGAFNGDRYFDIFIEYAKDKPEDILIKITCVNRGPDPARIHVLPQLWFRNTWSWSDDGDIRRPHVKAGNGSWLEVHHPQVGDYRLYYEGSPELLFCDNETNSQKLFGSGNSHGYFKDAFHEYVIDGRQEAVNPARTGTKATAYDTLSIAAGESQSIRLRLSKSDAGVTNPFADFDTIYAQRRADADEFYDELQEGVKTDDAKLVQRQALAGMIWSKQFYHYDIPRWLNGDPGQPAPPPQRKEGRNHEWFHLNNADVVSMPDKWEYPWYAAWDLAFHCLPLALVDPQFAKHQLVLMTREWYMHPNGQLPAYEWAFGDVNPPVHAWATWRVYQIDRKQTGKPDRDFLERVFHKLMLNFTWWVNRKDYDDRNVFQGGFLGLDNIGVFDRSAPLMNGGRLDQADGTAWMGMYCLNLMRIALELAKENPVYQDIATKFFEHFLHIAEAINSMGEDAHGLWDEEDEFYYDMLHLPNGEARPMKIRSMVGLVPLFAIETLEADLIERAPEFAKRLEWVLENRPHLANLVSRWQVPGRGERRLLALLRGHRMKRVLARMLDETEFLSDYGIRAVSRYHKDHPYVLHCDGQVLQCYGQDLSVEYQPAESNTGMFGGNSNWRGPIWFPVNYLIVESLEKFHHYYGDDFKVECPTNSGNYMTINEVAQELSRRLCSIFLKDADGKRAVFGQYPHLQENSQFRDHLLFHEYFHGDTGRGVGASHQTGWTGVVAKLLHPKREAVH
ncbi:Mannosyl oligosaccharide glucosidase [Planctomycetes bacterium Pan216]|uniref:Mannosyl oligosaccharide glucosidase n=1 Tax=Kolteria novifilia TaxID=2527975 RepID=A0A518B051_9BACT|nr:Mannosyl oligosaccharide glucosidase [Planctomycetes bacterium Pan216]